MCLCESRGRVSLLCHLTRITICPRQNRDTLKNKNLFYSLYFILFCSNAEKGNVTPMCRAGSKAFVRFFYFFSFAIQIARLSKFFM